MKEMLFKDISVSYTESGKGNCVVLLHGYLENQLMWEDFVDDFAKKYRVITIDLLGHGKTAPLGYVQTMEDNADVVYAVLNHLRIRKAIIAGHSMGGYVALAFAELYPENVKAIALINSTSKADSDERKSNRDRAIKCVKQDFTSFVRMSISNLFSEGNRERLDGEIEKVKLEALKTPLQGIVASLEGMKVRKDRELLLNEGKFPVLLVLGEKDPVLNYEDNAPQADYPNVELLSFPDGHMSPIENHEELKRTLLEFFKKV
ncbi:MAG: alpha/beta hydrolase [Flavobacterium sp.]|nr:MAG: alpha/beta hydrolase [Flavobacterium sp.]